MGAAGTIGDGSDDSELGANQQTESKPWRKEHYKLEEHESEAEAPR